MSLKFFSTEKDRDFRQYYLVSSLPGLRISMILTMILFGVFSTMNKIFFPDDVKHLYFNKFQIILPVIILTLIITYIPFFRKWLYHAFIIVNLMVALAIYFVISTSNPAQPGYEYHFAWVMIVIAGLFAFYRLPFLTLSMIGLLQVIAFAVATITNGTLHQNPFLYENNLFYIIATFSTGVMLAYMFRQINLKEFADQKIILDKNENLLSQIEERKHISEVLEQSRKQYRATLDAFPDWIYVVDRNYNIIFINSSLGDNCNVFDDSYEGDENQLVNNSFLRSLFNHEITEVFNTGNQIITEQELTFKTCKIFIESRHIPVFGDGEVFRVLNILRNRSKEREVEYLKNKNAEQKELLLREIHHRVKNNLAIVISLLNLQMRKSNDPVFLKVIGDIEMRIRSMALLHEYLYRSENLEKISLSSYLRSLAGIIIGAFTGHRVKLVLDLEEMESIIEVALPVGLIVNELLTNAVKYAFPDKTEGEVKLSLKKVENEDFIIKVSDNGVGLPENFSIMSENSLGMFIVRLLTEQLDGTFRVEQGTGTTFIVQFPMFIKHKRYNLLRHDE